MKSFSPGESSSEEDLTKEVVRKVFEELPGTPDTVGKIMERMTKPNNSQLDAIHGKRIQLLGYDTCRRTAIELSIMLCIAKLDAMHQQDRFNQGFVWGLTRGTNRGWRIVGPV